VRACSSAPCSTLGWPNKFSYVESIFYPAIIHQWVRGEFKNVLKLSISETCLLVFAVCCIAQAMSLMCAHHLAVSEACIVQSCHWDQSQERLEDPRFSL
jgi:hypothetical protein